MAHRADPAIFHLHQVGVSVLIGSTSNAGYHESERMQLGSLIANGRCIRKVEFTLEGMAMFS